MLASINTGVRIRPLVNLEWLLFPLIGLFAGLGAGLFGIGGGFLIVALLSVVLAREGVAAERIMHLSIGSSLASIVFTSISSLLAHHRRGAVLWPVFRRLLPGIILGTLAGAWLAGLANTNALQIFFGLFALAAALQIGLELRPAPHRDLPGMAGMTAAGAGIGIVSALAGIGGGAASNPFLLWCNVRIHNSVATAAACGLPIATAGALGFIWSGWDEPNLPPGSTGFVFWPAALGIAMTSVLVAPLGARLAHALPVRTLRRAFAVVLGLIGIRMLMVAYL